MPQSKTLRIIAAIFACLFLMSGLEDQSFVQLSFLLLSAVFLLWAEHAAQVDKFFRGQLQKHPVAWRELNVWLGRWVVG